MTIEMVNDGQKDSRKDRIEVIKDSVRYGDTSYDIQSVVDVAIVRPLWSQIYCVGNGHWGNANFRWRICVRSFLARSGRFVDDFIWSDSSLSTSQASFTVEEWNLPEIGGFDSRNLSGAMTAIKDKIARNIEMSRSKEV